MPEQGKGAMTVGSIIPWRVAPQQCCLRFIEQEHYNIENRKGKN
jgi:hypothetical protein